MSAIAFSTSAPLAAGQQIAGCYLLKQRIPTADARELWLATDEVLGKDVTAYFLPEAILQDARAISDLRQEVKRNRQLSHPNILRIYDFVEDGGRVAITMDRLDAECLADLLQRKGPFEGHEIKSWVTQIAETLSDAHRIQLFHRDLSPANFFLRPGGKVTITNFGISRLIHEALERAGELKGEAAHLAGMSPQLLDGERPTASDDVYGLGALAFTLLTGRAPFTGENLVPQIRKVPAPAVNAARAADRRPAVSPGWEQVIAACLAKAPEQRPKSCGEIVTLLGLEKSAPPSESMAPAAASAAAVSTPKSVPQPPVTSTSAAKEVSRASEPPLPPEPKAPMEHKPTVEKPVIEKPVIEKPAVEHKVTEVSRIAPPSNPPKTLADSVPNLPPPVPTTKPKPKPAPLSANYPDLDRPKSKLPMVGLLLAAAALATGIYFKNTESDNGGKVHPDGAVTPTADGSAPGTGENPPKIAEIAGPGSGEAPVVPPGTPPEGTPAPAAPVPPTAANAGAPPDLGALPVVGVEDPKKPTEEPILVAKNEPKVKPAAPKPAEPKPAEPKPAEPKPAPAPAEPEAAPTGPSAAVPLPPAPAPLPKLVIPANATAEQLNQLLADRQAAGEEFAKVAAKAEKSHAANLAMRDVKQSEFEEHKKILDEKRKVLSPVIKAAAESETERKRLEESRVKAEAAAKEAVKAADAAKLALEQLMAGSSEKLAERDRAEAEMKDVTQAVTERTRQLEEISQGVSKSESLRQQMVLAKKQTDQELQSLITALDKATKVQRDAMIRQNKPKIEAAEKQIREVDGQIERFQKALTSLQAIEDPSTQPTITSLQGKITEATAKKGVIQEEIKRLSGLGPVKAAPAPAPRAAEPPPAPPVKTATPPTPATPPTSPAAAVPVSPAPAAPVPTVPTPPAPAPTAPTPVSLPMPPEPAVVVEPAAGANSLGMKFVPVGDVQFSVYLVTRKNFQTFADSTNHKVEHWKNPGFAQTPEHPVVNVTWKDAESFCKWLTDKERKGGQIKATEGYRLPTDLEWSKAVGLPPETGATPEDRDMGVADVYPWGTSWPPPEGAGNFAGEETVTELPIVGYNDKFANTSPVGSFKPNKAGLYDMGGNVWQWVQDSFDTSGNSKTLRGGSWYNGSLKLSLLSSCRIKSTADQLNDTYGFRIVKAAVGKSSR